MPAGIQISAMKKNVILSAYSFAPRQGSESGTAWATALTLAQEYQVTVVCAGHYRKHFQEDDLIHLSGQGIEVKFFEDDRHFWLLKLPGGMIRNKIYYIFWQQAIREVFRELIHEKKPAFVQHVTWGNGTVPSGLAGLGVPFVFGPAGGFECGSDLLSRKMGWQHRLKEAFRRALISRSKRSRKLKDMYAKADLVFACTDESERAMARLGARNIVRMTNAGIYTNRVKQLQEIRSSKKQNALFEIFFASRLVGWKGEEIAIRAVAKLNDKNWKLTILGSGPNLNRSIQLSERLGVSSNIQFIQFLPDWEQVWRLYAFSDLFLFLSLHDSGGTGALEAMGAGLPVITLDLGGPSDYIDETCGVKIPVEAFPSVIQNVTNAIQNIKEDEVMRSALGKRGLERCLESFTWEARGSALLDAVRPLAKH
jgi:glycosyltransferase involved in cell wall biosynthesis